MDMNSSKDIVRNIISSADIEINGDRPWDLQVHNEDFYKRVLSGGSLALGESYMDGWWDAEELDQFFFKIRSSGVPEKIKKSPAVWWSIMKAKVLNPQKGKRAYNVGKAHYDLGDDLFEKMLDKRRVYSCAYWKGASNLEEAQKNKLDLICRKLGLKEGMHILDIGCGWGALVKYASQNYGVSAVGVTVSKDQYEIAKKVTEGLPVEIKYADYRDLNEKFDRIVSVGMFEHVGSTNYRNYMEVVNRNLKDNGLHMVHTIGRNTRAKPGEVDPWIGKYIFPNGQLPSLSQVTKSAEGLFVSEDVHNFGLDYDKTLMAWKQNFEMAWPQLKNNYDERFYRMWNYYLGSTAGSFRARAIQLWQVVFSKEYTEEYISVR